MDLETWKKKATVMQQDFADHLGDRVWEKYKMPGEKDQLWQKIAYAVYGERKKTCDNQGLNADQQAKVTELQNKCIDHFKGGDVTLAFLFVVAAHGLGTKDACCPVFPLIRLMKAKDKKPTDSYFLDHNGRIYENWKAFQDDNLFNGFWLCVPKDAMYPFNSAVHVRFLDQTQRDKALETVDKVSTFTLIASGFGMFVGGLMTLFPPTAPIGAIIVTGSAAAGLPGIVYSTGRDVSKLVDRKKHDQSISLFDKEARSYWFDIGTNLLTVATVGTAEYLAVGAKAGRIASTGTRMFFNSLNATSMSVMGVSIVNSIYHIVEETKHGEKVGALEVMQLIENIFFFTHGAVNYTTANKVIETAQRARISAERQHLSPAYYATFDVMHQAKKEMVEPGKVHEIQGNAEFIKEITYIKSENDFFEAFGIVQDGQLSIYNQLVIDPKPFLQMTETQRTDVLRSSKALAEGSISLKEFTKQMAAIQKEYRFVFERQQLDAKERLMKGLKTDDLSTFDVGGVKILKDTRAIMRLDQVFKHSGKNYNSLRIKAGLEISQKVKCQNVTEVAAVFEYTLRSCDERVKEQRLIEDPNGLKSKKQYEKEYYEKFLKDQTMQQHVIANLENLKNRTDAENIKGVEGVSRFANSFAAANHFDKHPFFPKVNPENNLTPQRYFEIAREITGGPVLNSKWTQDGKSLVCEFDSPKYGAIAIRYDNLSDGVSVIATLMAKREEKIQLRQQ